MAKKLGVTKLSSPRPELKKSIILIRGLGRTSAFWLDFPRHLSEKANVVMIDLPGGGRSPSCLGRGDIVGLARDVLGTLEQEGLNESHVLGISLGGMIVAQAAAIAEQGNKPFASLVIINSSARFTKQKRIAPAALINMLLQMFRSHPRHRFFAKYIVSDGYLQSHKQIPELWDSLWRAEKISRLPVIRQLLAAAKFWGAAVYSKLKTPVLFLASREDKLVSWMNSVMMWQAVNGARLQTFELSGHDLPTECPAEVAAAVFEFCLQQEGSVESVFEFGNIHEIKCAAHSP